MRGRRAHVALPRHDENQKDHDHSKAQEKSDSDDEDENRVTQRQMRAGKNESKVANHVKLLQHHAPHTLLLPLSVPVKASHTRARSRNPERAGSDRRQGLTVRLRN